MTGAPPHVLLLGGSTEATRFAALLAADRRFRGTVSLAGATSLPAPSPLPRRIGGFGGVAGLRAWLVEHRVAALVDATHPFAATIGANARAAAAEAAIPLLRLTRPPWRPGPDDRWTIVDAAGAAARALGAVPRRVLLTVGRRDLEPFRDGSPHAYLLRAVDRPPPALLPSGARVLLARGPFALADEHALFRRERIEALVCKNSGGDATRAKLDAARAAGAAVIMIRRPFGTDAPDAIDDPEGAMARLVEICLGAGGAS